jgi:hypothetical protein
LVNDMNMDDREFDSRELSAVLLARTEPSPEELAEQAERASRNRVESIMATPPAVTPSRGTRKTHHGRYRRRIRHP